MDYAAAIRLLADTEEAVTKHGFSVGQDVRAQIGSAVEGSGAAVLLWLGQGLRDRAAEVLVALEESGFKAAPCTMEPAAQDVVGWLQNGGIVDVRQMQGD